MPARFETIRTSTFRVGIARCTLGAQQISGLAGYVLAGDEQARSLRGEPTLFARVAHQVEPGGAALDNCPSSTFPVNIFMVCWFTLETTARRSGS